MVHTHENAKSKEGISETENNGLRQKRKKKLMRKGTKPTNTEGGYFQKRGWDALLLSEKPQIGGQGDLDILNKFNQTPNKFTDWVTAEVW